MGDEIRPFRVEVPQAALEDLRQRLAMTRWPERETASDWSQGVPLDKMRALVTYWAQGYDWRAAEARLNAFPQFRTQIDGLGIHFLHVQSKHENALPIILTHGWPGSVFEFLKVIGPLVDPTAHGGKVELYVPQSYRDAQAPFAISSISRSGGLVTVNTASNNPFRTNQSVTIAGVADASFDGKYQIVVNSPTQFIYGQHNNSSSTSSGGTATLITNAVSFYRNVVARTCRSCHVATIDGYNFDHYQNIAPFTYDQGRFADTGFDMEANVCGGSQQVARDHMMPNSLVTFNRLWLTYKNGVGLLDQVSIINRFYGSDNTNNKPCGPGTNP